MTFPDIRRLLSSRLFSSYFIRSKIPCVIINSIHMDIKNEVKSSTEIITVPPIVSTYRQALLTFEDINRKDFKTNMSKLKTLVDKLKPEDLGFDKAFTKLETWYKPNKAPCTYIEVFQNNIITMGIFVLKPGFKMPLHDHPEMYGLLKVISGVVNIRSYSEYPLHEPESFDFTTRAKYEAARLAQGIFRRRRFFAQVSSSQTCRCDSEACFLTPTISNFHEIQALTMPAAFFDILAPPYDTVIRNVGPRVCRYYEVANEISTNVVELQEITVPDCFYCDQAPYRGLPLC